MLHDDYIHQRLDCTFALVQQRFYWSMMYQDILEYVTNYHMCKVTKGYNTGPQTQQGFILANNALDRLCIGFLKIDPSKDSKEDILLLTDAFTKFIQAFITNRLKATIILEFLDDKWFHMYGTMSLIHSDKGHSVSNEHYFHMYPMYNIKHSKNTAYNFHGNSQCERFICTLLDLIKTLPKEENANWPFHIPSLVSAFNAMPHCITGYQPCELMPH